MKLRSQAALCLLAFSLAAAAQAQNLVTYKAQPAGSKVKIDGTSTVHDWTVESSIVGGTMDLDSALVDDPTKAAPGKVNAKVQVSVPVRQLKSGKNAMDVRMYEALNATKFQRIDYRLTDLTLKEAPKDATAPLQLESKGELTVSGVTNKVSFPVTLTRVDKDKIRVTGNHTLKMTDFKIEPPAPKIALGLIKTGDEIKISFDWLTAKAAATAAK